MGRVWCKPFLHVVLEVFVFCEAEHGAVGCLFSKKSSLPSPLVLSYPFPVDGNVFRSVLEFLL